MRRTPWLILAIVLLPALSGCLGDDDDETPWISDPVQDQNGKPYKQPGDDWETDTLWRSSTLKPGPYGVPNETDFQEAFVPVDLPPEERDAGFPEDPVMHVAYWLPEVPEGTQVPVILSIHPYYDFGDPGSESPGITEPDGGVGQWIYDEFIAHGYALAQSSTFGTGKSTHCQDVKGRSEQLGIQAVVDWLGEQEWSNGNVGVIGKSYAGTTTWEAAQAEDAPHLKTIVPISGSIGVRQMFYRNGSAESRSFIYDVLYEEATVDEGDPAQELRLCSDSVLGPVTPWTTAVAAEYGGDQWNGYWDERYHLQDVLDNYQGSVYLVWGFQDWNVDPYHAFPTFQRLKEAGIETRGIFGQWQHNYPDQPFRSEENGGYPSGYGGEAAPYMWRLDWAEDMLAWFDHYLKEEGPRPNGYAQVQDNYGQWRLEETYPAPDIEWKELNLASGMERISTFNTVAGLDSVGASFEVIYESLPMVKETRIAGLPQFHVGASSNCLVPGECGGQLFVQMQDAETDLRLGHAIMDLRYREGGYEARTVMPFVTYTMQMEFNPMDVVVPEGHAIRLVITITGEDYVEPLQNWPITIEESDDSVLRLPIVERPKGHPSFFTPPEWYEGD